MRAVVIGAGGGIGAALAAALAEEENDVVRLTRAELDLTDEPTIAAAAARVGKADLVVVATGLLHDAEHGPEKALRDLDPAWLAQQYAVNAIGPALVAKHFLPILPRTGRSVFAALSARVGSISDNRLGGWYGYRASKAALNQLIRTLAIEDKRRNDRGIVVALHPGTVDTRLSKPFQQSGRDLFQPDRAAVQLLDVLDALKPADSGKLFAWDGAEIAP
ncbi:NAD(P)-dependent dehydrogenase (short-subunit alcohol dehydrogenase family) [Sphingomonas endophytica]|uniref:NAD(P)-dependent dehydrogenase (Short-subunit alcohol dehydrogenase family) n=1 Tax=Sphingomonas endophytica TaxID=869719 RepID=A0A7X0JE06_9SPHN|nr:SDR family NAD(P)-dependent oxidoreductase [Sphingomonas endophytica]MBB6504912.1 NAD(P)-dependent dehydrogenase (short-subunit alcohol dehydrogenase family) [Sphingomonas endophytica]